MPRITKYQKQLIKYRDYVHKYLDGIWQISSKPRKARGAVYSWLATQLSVTEQQAHVSKMDLSMCKRAISVLKPRFIQLYGYDICEEVPYLYKLKKSFKLQGTLSFLNDLDSVYSYSLYVEVYCQRNELDSNGMLEDYDGIKTAVIDKLSDKYINTVFSLNPTYENIARWICEQVLTAYQVTVTDDFGNSVTYLENNE